MDRRETYIFTHYTDIADAKEREIRNLKAEVVRGIMLGVAKALLGIVHRAGNNLIRSA